MTMGLALILTGVAIVSWGIGYWTGWLKGYGEAWNDVARASRQAEGETHSWPNH